jgi:hypothetical protein
VWTQRGCQGLEYVVEHPNKNRPGVRCAQAHGKSRTPGKNGSSLMAGASSAGDVSFCDGAPDVPTDPRLRDLYISTESVSELFDSVPT